MIITDFNQMTISELNAIHRGLGVSFDINDGKIVGTEKIPTTDRKSE